MNKLTNKQINKFTHDSALLLDTETAYNAVYTSSHAE